MEWQLLERTSRIVQRVRSLAQAESLTTVYLDIFSCRNEADFYREFTAAVLKQTSSKFQEWMEYAKEFLSGISPRFTLGSNPDLVPLGKITTDHWVRYIKERFESTGKEISNTLAEKVCLTVENHSSYVQQLSWLLWIYTEKIATEELFNTAINDLIDQNTPFYQKETETLTSYQLNFIKALVDGIQQDFTSQHVLQTYKLGTSANITIMRKALLKKELIDVESKKISLTDPVFTLWFKRNFTT